MKFAISNIAWNNSEDETVYQLLKQYGITGLEIAPTRLINNEPYLNLGQAHIISSELHRDYGLVIPSMQSILYGRNERLFGDIEERKTLLEYLYKAIDFAQSINCNNLVFGSPKNRNYNSSNDLIVAETFFREAAEYCIERATVLSIEANPTIYGTNFINTTVEAAELVKKINHPGFKINLDLGTIIQNNESTEVIYDIVSLVNHVHISEPYLETIASRPIHNRILDILNDSGYEGYISIEMKRNDIDPIGNVKKVIEYILKIIKK